MHNSPEMRQCAMVSCEYHYQQFAEEPNSDSLLIYKKDRNGNHYDGEAYIAPPSSTLSNHVKHTISLASGNVYPRKIVEEIIPNTSAAVTAPIPTSVLSATVKREVTFPAEMLRILNLACTSEYQLPAVMDNFVGKIRTGRGNTTFLHNMFGLTLWTHLTGKCWVKNQQLNPQHNKWDCNRLQNLLEDFLASQYDLGMKLLHNRMQFDTNKLATFCSTMRMKHSKHGTWNVDSDAKDGVFIRQFELLDKIGFVWNEKKVK